MRLTGRIPFGAGSRDDAQRAVRVLRGAVELGVNHVDTAAFYRSSLHSSNELIRTALWPYPENFVIATKVMPDRFRGGPSLRDQVEENRNDLGVDSLEMVYLRAMEGAALVDDFIELSKMRDEGLIRNLALSGVTEQQLGDASAIAPVTAIQNRYGIGVRRDESVLRAATARSIAFVPYFSIAAEGKHSGPAKEDHADVRDVATAHGVSVAAVRIAWTLELGANVLAIPGTGSLQHLEENVAAAQLQLTPDEVALLSAVPPPQPA